MDDILNLPQKTYYKKLPSGYVMFKNRRLFLDGNSSISV